MTKYQRYHRTRRARLLDRLGGECARPGCGERFGLEVDHILGDGGVERKRRGAAGVITYLLSLPDEALHEYVMLLCGPHHLEKSLLAGDLAWANER